MQLVNGRRQLRKFFHRGETMRKRALYGTQYQSLYLLGGTVLGFGLGYLAAYYLRKGLLTGEESEAGELSDWGSAENPLEGNHGV